MSFKDTLNPNAGRPNPHAGGLQHFGFSVAEADFEAALKEVRGSGAEVVSVGEHGPGQPYAYVKDPDGYLIEL